jgi:hypothetical protein
LIQKLNPDTSQPVDAFEWDIYKRYSNFTALHELMLPYFKALGILAPKLPP